MGLKVVHNWILFVVLSATDWKVTFFRLVRKIPFVQRKVAEELDKTVQGLEKEMNDQIGGMKYNSKMPEKGWPKEKVLKEIEQCMNLGELCILALGTGNCQSCILSESKTVGKLSDWVMGHSHVI